VVIAPLSEGHFMRFDSPSWDIHLRRNRSGK
jgi:hypothetical protein